MTTEPFRTDMSLTRVPAGRVIVPDLLPLMVMGIRIAVVSEISLGSGGGAEVAESAGLASVGSGGDAEIADGVGLTGGSSVTGVSGMSRPPFPCIDDQTKNPMPNRTSVEMITPRLSGGRSGISGTSISESGWNASLLFFRSILPLQVGHSRTCRPRIVHE